MNPINRGSERLDGLIGKIKRYHGRSIGEENTKASLIEPLLETLDWDTRDLDDVHREYKAKRSDKPVDYALQLQRKPCLFLEAKGLGENLSDRKWVAQVLWYATVAGVTWCVVTDGDEYRFYNAAAPVDAEDKLFCRIRLSEDTAEDIANTLSLMSKAGLEARLPDKYWKAHFVDRRVNAALRQLITGPDTGLVRLIRKRATELTRKEIADSIVRLEIKSEPPPAWSRRAPTEPEAVGSKPHKRGKKAGKVRSKRQMISVTLKEIIASGSLPTPLRLFRKYKKQMLEATLHRDGTVEFNGKKYDSCSAAAEHARGTITGRPMNTNGWQFWQYDDGKGKKRELLDARAEFLNGKSR